MGRMHRVSARRSPIEIGLLNNMPDALLHATERQFTHLLRAAAGAHEVRLRFFSLPEVPRGEYTRTYMRAIYGDLDEMLDAGLDGLIVTGADSGAADMADQPYWDRLTQVIDWSEVNLAASYWSGQAAQAAVRHLDGVRHIALGARLSGVFESEPVGDDPMLAHLPAPIRTPHSRLIGLDEQELSAYGYGVITRSAEAGVDMFVRRDRSLMVFGQGHPEYDADTLLHEFCRDADAYLRNGRGALPAVPIGYLNRKIERAFAVLARRESNLALMDRYDAIAAVARPRQTWRSSAVALFRNWLHHIAASKAKAARARLRAQSRVQSRTGSSAHP